MNIKKNRRRGKEVEKRVAKKMGGIRLGILGGEDVWTDRFSVEVKSRKKLVIEKWFEQAEKNAKGKIPVLVCHRKSGKRYYVVLRLEDFLGLVKEGG